MRRISIARQAMLVAAALIATTGLTASSASAAPNGTITGTLLAAPNVGAAWTEVRLDGPSLRTTVTDGVGAYAFADITPGVYRVQFLPRNRPTQYAYGKVNRLQATEITVDAGQTVTVNDTLLPVGQIYGRFVNADGSPAGSADVNTLPVSSSAQSAHGTTAADGTYTIAVLPGAYRVEFVAQGGFRQYAHGTTDYSSAAVFTVAAGQSVQVDDTMIATGSVAGRITTASGVPVQNSQVQLVGGIANLDAYTDQSGNYRFPNVIPGEYAISARNPARMTMWGPRTLDPQQAQKYRVSVRTETTINLAFLPTGTISGRFTDGGVGVPGVQVYVTDEAHNSASAMTNASGDYTIPEVFGGDYRVRFSGFNPRISQYAHGKVSLETANVFRLTPGTTLTVNDTRLSPGMLRLTARDALTGAAVTQVYAALGEFSGSTGNGELIIGDIPEGIYTARIFSTGYQGIEQTVAITGGQMLDIEVILAPMGRVPVTVVDAATGSPVRNACVFLEDPPRVTVPDGCNTTDDNGRLTLYASTGSYVMMALPPTGSNYGVQWVGPNGGVGDQRQARVVSVVNGQTSPAITIRMDRAGAIAGRVTSETGQPLKSGSVALLTVNSSVGGFGWGTAIEPDGSFRLEGLGPYQWPLLLEARDHAYQWSGDKSNRFEAQKIQVTSGGTATYNHVMKVGTAVLTGTVKDQQGRPISALLRAFNSVTGDYAAQIETEVDRPYVMRFLGPQQVKLVAEDYWYNGTSEATAGLLSLITGTSAFNLCAKSPTMMIKCTTKPVPEGPRPPGPPPPPLQR